jgi:hypothetical protein
MPNHLLDDYLDDVKDQLKHLPATERSQVLRDVKDHLNQEIAALRKSNKGLSLDEATIKATHDFGDPRDLGVAYGSQGGVIRKSTGEVLLRVAVLASRGVARTVRTTVKWTGIVLLVLLALTVAVGITAAFIGADLLKEYKDEIATSVPRPIYGYSESWTLPDLQTTVRMDSFQVSTDARGFDLFFDLRPETGCLGVVVTNPSGTVAYQNGEGCDATSRQLHFAQQGTWSIQYTFAAFTGTAEAEAYEYLERATA